MTASNNSFWKKKLAAWLHDPAEKALVLMRDVDDKGRRIGHEDGSLKDLRAALDISKADFEPRADHLAAGADRPSWPEEKDGFRPAWANVRFVEEPVLIHPLSGENISLGKLDDIQAAHVRNASLQHFLGLIERDAEGQVDYRQTLLAFWRFGPEPRIPAMPHMSVRRDAGRVQVRNLTSCDRTQESCPVLPYVVPARGSA